MVAPAQDTASRDPNEESRKSSPPGHARHAAAEISACSKIRPPGRLMGPSHDLSAKEPGSISQILKPKARNLQPGRAVAPRKPALEVKRARCSPSNFPAAGLGDALRSNQHHLVGWNP